MKLRSGRQTGVLVNQKCSKPSYRCSPALLVISVYISTILICVVNSKNICVDDVKDYVSVSWNNIQENLSIIRANIGKIGNQVTDKISENQMVDCFRQCYNVDYPTN